MNPAVFHSIPPVILKVPVLARQEVEQQAIVRATIDVVTLPPACQ